MADQNKHCRLCSALENPFVEGEVRKCDTTLLKIPHFVLLPCIGPLVIGHVMIVSRKHFSSLASMPEDAIRECEQLLQSIYRLPDLHGDILQVEHGSTADCDSGACVAHAHVHVLPGLAEHADLFDRSLSLKYTFTELRQIRQLRHPYVMVRANVDKIQVFISDSLPRQALRQMLCARLGQVNWDWRTDPRSELIQESVRFWTTALDRLDYSIRTAPP